MQVTPVTPEVTDNGPPHSGPTYSLEVGDPAQYLNRELSWLEFNARVLSEAEGVEVPIIERLKFLGIFASNLDEFFMVRVAGLKAQRERTAEVPPDGMTAVEQLAAISSRVHALVDRAWSFLEPYLRQAEMTVFSREAQQDTPEPSTTQRPQCSSRSSAVRSLNDGVKAMVQSPVKFEAPAPRRLFCSYCPSAPRMTSRALAISASASFKRALSTGTTSLKGTV